LRLQWSQLAARTQCPCHGRMWAAQQVPADIEPPPGLPSPPKVPVAQPQWQQAISSRAQRARLSVGSIGHPHCCGQPCRYFKRKGGCRDGVNCPNCHLCFWRRGAGRDGDSSTSADVSATFEEPESIGTLGHPVSCGGACKYVRRKGGCRDGANCRKCHLCLWQREKPTEKVNKVATESSVGLFGDSGENLRSLIGALLSQQADGDN